MFRGIDGAERTTTRSAYRKIERKDEKKGDEKEEDEKKGIRRKKMRRKEIRSKKMRRNKMRNTMKISVFESQECERSSCVSCPVTHNVNKLYDMI